MMCLKISRLGICVLEVRGGGVVPLPYLLQQQKYNLTEEILPSPQL
ncbi:MAG: hypothetical protein ACLUIQ_02470 [Dialister invisus]